MDCDIKVTQSDDQVTGLEALNRDDSLNGVVVTANHAPVCIAIHLELPETGICHSGFDQ